MISKLSQSKYQSQKATYVGLISKELYYDFKVVFQKLIKHLQNS